MKKALLILIDGCRTDVLKAAAIPAIDGLMEKSAWTLEAQTVFPSITLPVHFSIFTSTGPFTHGVLTNGGRPPVSPAVMDMFLWVKSLGKTTAMYYNWEFLRELSPAGNLDRSLFFNTNLEPGGDMAVAQAAAADITNFQPDFAFVYLGCLDETGHAKGYQSNEYIKSLEAAGQAAGHILDTLDRTGLTNTYTILLQSDHGGLGNDHSDPSPEVMTIPWMIAGPGITPGQLTCQVSVLDTMPTLAQCMDIPRPAQWQGRILANVSNE